LTGDYINDEEGLPVARETVRLLAAEAPVFLVTGNFDLGLLPEDAFQGTGAVLLRKDARELSIRGTLIRVSGLAVGDEPFFPLLRRKLPPRPSSTSSWPTIRT